MPKDADLEKVEVSRQSCPPQQLETAHLSGMSAAFKAPLLPAHVWQSSSKLAAPVFSLSLRPTPRCLPTESAVCCASPTAAWPPAGKVREWGELGAFAKGCCSQQRDAWLLGESHLHCSLACISHYDSDNLTAACRCLC